MLQHIRMEREKEVDVSEETNQDNWIIPDSNKPSPVKLFEPVRTSAVILLPLDIYLVVILSIKVVVADLIGNTAFRVYLRLDPNRPANLPHLRCPRRSGSRYL